MPCGYLEREDHYRGLAREFKEETNLTVEKISLYDAHSNFHNPDIPTVGIYYMVHSVVNPDDLKAQDDLKEVAFYDVNNLPDMAFPSDLEVIKRLILEEEIKTL